MPWNSRRRAKAHPQGDDAGAARALGKGRERRPGTPRRRRPRDLRSKCGRRPAGRRTLIAFAGLPAALPTCGARYSLLRAAARGVPKPLGRFYFERQRECRR